MPDPDPEILNPALDRALAPYARLLPQRTLEKIREEMRAYVTTHPYPAAHLRELTPETAHTSHVREKGDDELVAEAPPEPGVRSSLRRTGEAGGGRR